MEDKIKELNLTHKFTSLENIIQSRETPQEQSRYNELDNQVIQCQQYAENKCRKSKVIFPWSPKLLHAGWKIKSINALIKYRLQPTCMISNVISTFIHEFSQHG